MPRFLRQLVFTSAALLCGSALITAIEAHPRTTPAAGQSWLDLMAEVCPHDVQRYRQMRAQEEAEGHQPTPASLRQIMDADTAMQACYAAHERQHQVEQETQWAARQAEQETQVAQAQQALEEGKARQRAHAEYIMTTKRSKLTTGEWADRNMAEAACRHGVSSCANGPVEYLIESWNRPSRRSVPLFTPPITTTCYSSTHFSRCTTR